MNHKIGCTSQERITVGFDDTAHSRAALRWAAREAEIRGTCLHLVYARMGREDNQRRIEDAAREILSTVNSDVAYIVESAASDPIETLVAAAHKSALLVVGTREPSPYLGVIKRSVSMHAASRATSPVVIIHEEMQRPAKQANRIVVGIDGTLSARDALLFAATEARHRNCPVVMVHVREAPGPEPWVDRLSYLKDDVFAGDLREIEVWGSLLQGNVGATLIDEARHADLLVLGARGYGRSSDVLHGSVTKACMDGSLCPVIVAASTPEDRSRAVQEAITDLALEWADEHPIDMNQVVSWLRGAILAAGKWGAMETLDKILAANPHPVAEDSDGYRIRQMTDDFPQQPGFDPRWPPFPPRGRYWRIP